jgi:hypothetical protein
MADRPNILFFHIDNLGFWGADLLQRRAVPGSLDTPDRRPRRAGIPADHLPLGSAVHSDPLRAADRAAREPLWQPQRAAGDGLNASSPQCLPRLLASSVTHGIPRNHYCIVTHS